MLDRIIAAMLLIAGVIHLLPVPGVVGGPMLLRLYGLPIEDPNLRIMLQHRAVLFGLLGLLLVAAAFKPAIRTWAAAGGLVSAGSFLIIAAGIAGYNAAIARVVVADIVAVACLLVAILLMAAQARH
jgi:hypothetical protein